MSLLQGPREGLFLVSEVPLYLPGNAYRPSCPHEVKKANIIKWTFRGFEWQWGLLFANYP